jgi:hypothetical protein
MLKSRILLLVISTACFQVSAETVYGSVDKEGRVTYSDTIPADAVEAKPVKIDTEQPSRRSAEESQQRARQMIEAANASQRRRDAERLKQEQAIKSAKQELDKAETQLDDARIFREGDRRGTAGGGNRITPEYQQRVKEAEANRAAAERRLQETRSGR